LQVVEGISHLIDAIKAIYNQAIVLDTNDLSTPLYLSGNSNESSIKT